MFLIENALIYTCDSRNTVIQGHIFVEKGVISKVAAGAPGPELRAGVSTVHDAAGALLSPGFVNAHTHIPMVLFRDLGEDMAGKDLLFKLFFPIEKAFVRPELVYDAAVLSCMELLSGGVTCFADMYYFEEQVAAAAKSLGLRAVLGQTIANFPTPDAPEPYGGLDLACDFVSDYKEDDLITPAYAPHASYSVSGDLLKEINRCGQEDGVPVLIHLVEMRNEAELMWEKLKENCEQISPIRYLEKQGLLSPRWLAAHCIQADDEDLQILRECGVRVSHNPLSNLKGEQGTARAPEMSRCGIPVGLGTDGPLGGNTQHLFAAMSYAYYLHRARLKSHTAVSAGDVLRWATFGGAEALGLADEIGSLEVGKQADMILWRKDSPALYQPLDIAAAIVLTSGAQDIDSVWVAGRQKLSGGRLLYEACDDALSKARSWRSEIAAYCSEQGILTPGNV